MAPAGEAWGYSPDAARAASLQLDGEAHIVLVGTTLADPLVNAPFRFMRSSEVILPRGVFFHLGNGLSRVLIVAEGIGELGFESATLNERVEEALAWLEYWWPQAEPVGAPRFSAGEVCVHIPTNSTTPVMERIPQSTGWGYRVFLQSTIQTVSEDALRATRSSSPLDQWLGEPPLTADDFGVVMTQAKIRNGLTDTLFSYGASKTMFRAYQFKPVLRFLDSHADRILIADEVGLGKTISAGLLWTELHARGLARRTLVVCPSSLLDKWIREMDERFNLNLEELTKERLDSLASELQAGRSPATFAYICSLERLRAYQPFEDPELPLDCDLVIVDEAHQLRNPDTASFRLGMRLSDWTRSLVMLSATPLNLGRRDLLSLTRMLLPGEVEQQEDLEQRLDHHPALNRLRSSLLDPMVTNTQRRTWLDQIRGARMGRAIAMRPAFSELEELLSKSKVEVDDVPRAREACAALEGLSAVLTRTRKAEVNEQRPVREPVQITVPWTEAERSFYEQFEQWAREVCKEYGLPPAFAMQMPLRLAGSCLTAAYQSLQAENDEDPDYGYSRGADTESVFRAVGLPDELRRAGARIGGVDTKLEALVERLRDVTKSRRRVLLFTFSRRTLAYLRQKLQGDFRVGVLHGGVSREDRDVIMRRFREHAYDIVLATRVASEGLDFEFCSIVVNYDLPWNPMEVEQRIGRIDRIGQEEAKIQIWNFATEGTIETTIVERLLERIGVFTESIGELEPIVGKQFRQAIEATLDFTLSREEQARELQRAEAAIAQTRLDRTRLNNEASRLQAEERFGIQDVEERIARGRYLSTHELRRLLTSWAKRHGGWVTDAADGTAIDLNVSSAMLRAMASWRHETEQTSPLVGMVQRQSARGPVRLYLEADQARKDGGILVNTNHPLVQTALTDDSARDGHTAHLRLCSDRVPAGHYLVLFGRATWDGLRPTREIWSAAYDVFHESVTGTEVGAEVLAALTRGGVADSTIGLEREAQHHLRLLASALEDRRRSEELHQQRLNSALVEERRLRADESARRRLTDLAGRAAKSPQMRRAFEGQMRRVRLRHEDEIARIEAASVCGMSLEPLAVCLVEAS